MYPQHLVELLDKMAGRRLYLFQAEIMSMKGAKLVMDSLNESIPPNRKMFDRGLAQLRDAAGL